MYKKSKLKIFFGLAALVTLLGSVFVLVILPLVTPASMTFVDYAAPEIGIAIDENLTIVYVLEGSAAEKAGLQSGDILKRVGDRQVTSASMAKSVSKEAIGAVTKPVRKANVVGEFEVGNIFVEVERDKLAMEVLLKPGHPTSSNPSQNAGRIGATPTAASSNLTYL